MRAVHSGGGAAACRALGGGGVRVGSLFSGVGGFDLAFERAGFEIAWQCEIDPYARAVLKRHWPDVRLFEDVRELGPDMWYDTAMKYQPPKKLTEKQIADSVLAYEAGDSLSTIAARYSVSRQSMWDLLRRRTVMRPQRRVGDENHFHRGGLTADDRAQNMVEYAIRAGSLHRPSVCEACGGTGQAFKDGRAPIQAHHADYNRPLDVMWLCKGCHHDWHRRFRAVPKDQEGGDANGSLPVVDVLVGGFP